MFVFWQAGDRYARVLSACLTTLMLVDACHWKVMKTPAAINFHLHLKSLRLSLLFHLISLSNLISLLLWKDFWHANCSSLSMVVVKCLNDNVRWLLAFKIYAKITNLLPKNQSQIVYYQRHPTKIHRRQNFTKRK